MKISYHSHNGGLELSQGYGTAGFGIVSALLKLGHEVPFNDPEADIFFDFTQPPMYQFYDTGVYHIGYTPWESTILPDGWHIPMMAVDELWTTSPLMAQWYQNAGIARDIKVFEHGIDHAWKPIVRRQHGPIKFLHIGSDVVRKNGQLVFDAFIEAFGRNNKDVQLTLKTHAEYTMIRKYQAGGLIYSPEKYSSNIKLVQGAIPLENLIMLVNHHDVMVYPSAGEGFGIIPLQTLATGMPTIMNTSWSSYKRFVDPHLEISDKLVNSPWPHEHPGKVFEPNVDDIVKSMLYVAENYDAALKYAVDNAQKVHAQYDWTFLTKRAFAPVIKKLTSGE